MNVTSIAQQHINNDKNSNQVSNSTTDFKDELNKYKKINWKEHKIEGLSPSANQALNNKLEEMGITSDREIYKVKAEMERTRASYESIGWDNSNYTENHIRSLEYSQNMGGLSDTNKKVLEVLYTIQENDLKNPSIKIESNKYLSNAMNKLLIDKKNKTVSAENLNQSHSRPKVSEYINFQKEIEQPNKYNAISLSV